MNTLAVVINHNRRDYTDQLVESLLPYREQSNYDIAVLDNGTPNPDEVSKYTTHETGENCYYGGALNLSLQMFLESDYDSLLVLNNDIIIHGPLYVSTLRDALESGYDLVSSCVLQPEVNQCFWRTMHNWKSPEIRSVPWVDFMAPMMSRRLAETIGQYDNELIYGWGQDLYSGLICSDNGWKVGVLDTISTIHMSSQTFRDGKSDITLSEYNQRASSGMENYFSRIGRSGGLNYFRELARNYTFTPGIQHGK